MSQEISLAFASSNLELASTTVENVDLPPERLTVRSIVRIKHGDSAFTRSFVAAVAEA
jgi:hypothetical protein